MSSTRRRSKSKLARPYIWRFKSLSFVICPSACRLPGTGALRPATPHGFRQSGEPFPFEKLERYQARRVRDRFTFDMLKEYLQHLGLSAFEEDFYLPEGAPAWLVEKTGPLVRARNEYTLERARAEVL